MGLARDIAGTVFATVVAHRRLHQARPELLVLTRSEIYATLATVVTHRDAGWDIRGRQLRVLGYPVVLDALDEIPAGDPGWLVVAV
jgi:hypothetical protein